MPMTAAELAAEFPIEGIEFAATESGLVKAVLAHGGMTGELYLQGAHVTAWQPDGARPVIFTSPKAVFAPGRAIRGGIPVIFPWFGPHPTDPKAPQHGLVRAAPWQLDRVAAAGSDITLELSLNLEGFALSHRVTFGTALHLALVVRNTSDRPASFEQALHSYFAISDIERIAVAGLEQSSHIDKTAGMARCPPAGAPLTFRRETDSVYFDVPGRLTIRDPGWNRHIVVDKSSAASAIVWNPWPEKAAGMADLGAENWRGMVCVETGNVADNRVTLPPGAMHAMTTRIALDAG
jgi:glucose-6-phosphate 1-epimerase